MDIKNGNESVISAGTIVIKGILKYSMAIGVPVKVVKY